MEKKAGPAGWIPGSEVGVDRNKRKLLRIEKVSMCKE